jgi:hypothetical protein
VERWTTTYVHIGEKAISNHKLMGNDYLCVKSSGYNHIALAIEEEKRPEWMRTRAVARSKSSLLHSLISIVLLGVNFRPSAPHILK